MKVAVIGSGHAAISALEALIEGGITPTVLDVGETLAPDIQSRVDALGATSPEKWARGTDHFPAAPHVGKLRKTVFGSDYIFAHDRPFASVRSSGTNAVPTFAKGGFSMGWGGTVLPARQEDLGQWPFAAERLEPHYTAALKTMPLAGEDDGLSDAFPLFGDSVGSMRLTAQGQRLLHDMKKAQIRLNQNGERFLFGPARLAVDQENCVQCGLCLTGCPYGLIYTPDMALDRMIKAGRVRYQSGACVISVEEKAGTVCVNWLDIPSGKKQSDTFDRVFVGAGALGSARIMLNSLKAYNQVVPVKDSAKFALPMLRFPGAEFDWPNTNTLADLFLEMIAPEISDHWMHIQISPLNEKILQSLGMNDERRLNGLKRLAKPLLNRLMVAWCALHSDLSDECELSISPGKGDVPTLNIRAIEIRSKNYARAYSHKLVARGLAFNTLFATPAMMLSSSCSTGHCGGSFPMRERPEAPFETDMQGRLKGWDRVHLIDASTFPSIPGTTIALLIRANARRIVAETKLQNTP